MKNKILIVLLTVVMVFGVLGLTACQGANPDSDYNYYGIKYKLEDVKIEAVTFQGVYKMFTTPGAFLLYVDSESKGADERFATINDLANDWGVTIYHFNPDLSGGYAADKGASANILTTNVKGDGIKAVQDTLEAITGENIENLKDNALWGIKGADSVLNGSELEYKGELSAQVAYEPEADFSVALACAQPVPSYGAHHGADKYVKQSVSTINLFGDARLHMYNDDNGVDALTAPKQDVYVTVANYAMFEHLMRYNDGYFSVFFGGTWCPNTQAIVKATNNLAKDYGIEKIYFFDPRLDDGTKTDGVKETKTFSYEKYLQDEANTDFTGEAGYTTTYAVVENSQYLASSLNTRSADPQDAWNELKELGQAKAYLKAVTIDNGKGFADSVSYKYDDDAIQTIIDDAIVSKAKTLSNYTTDSAKYIAEQKAKVDEKDYKEPKEIDVANYVISQFNKKQTADASKVDADKVALNALNVAIGKETAINETFKTAVKAMYNAKTTAAYNYNYLYATFLDEYLPVYRSQWNVGIKLNINGKEYTKMCVPNIMMFNGEGDGPAQLVALAEAEYTYANVNEQGNAQQIAWDNAVKEVFDANPYATYAPMISTPGGVVPETSAPQTGGSSNQTAGGSSNSSADGAC